MTIKILLVLSIVLNIALKMGVQNQRRLRRKQALKTRLANINRKYKKQVVK